MLNRLVLLAHPDDEMLCLPFLIEPGADDFQQDFFLYLTLNSLSESRVSESKEAVNFLNREIRKSKLVDFDFSLRDGLGWKDFNKQCLQSLFCIVQDLKINSILTFAYEGGHQDHDLANVISKALQNKTGIEVVEFSGYRKHRRLPMFVVCTPVTKVSKIVYSRSKALWLFFKLALIHKSQFRVWSLLSPPIVSKLLTGSAFATQSALYYTESNRVKYLYELRGKAHRDSVENAILRFV
jgi:LmbE family N-acetylglucosaminyl deacetylase